MSAPTVLDGSLTINIESILAAKSQPVRAQNYTDIIKQNKF